jgi:hypothetical protein
VHRLRKKSGWSYDTSATGAVSYGFITAGTGDIFLRSPIGGRYCFKYAAGGWGFSLGGKLNLSYSTLETWSVGTIYLLDTFHGSELTAADLQGVCLIQDVSIGAGLGSSGVVMLLGVPPTSLPREILKLALPKGVAGMPGIDVLIPGTPGGPLGAALAMRRAGSLVLAGAKAALLMAGFSAGPQLQVGFSNSLGLVYEGGETVASFVERWVRRYGVPQR